MALLPNDTKMALAAAIRAVLGPDHAFLLILTQEDLTEIVTNMTDAAQVSRAAGLVMAATSEPDNPDLERFDIKKKDIENN